MIILTYRLRPAMVAALTKAVAEGEAKFEVAFQLEKIDRPDQLERQFGSAAMVVFDLAGERADVVYDIVVRQLESHPFVKTIVVPVALATADEQRYLFRYGKCGVWSLPKQADAATTNYWCTRIARLTGFDVVRQAQNTLRGFLPTCPRGDFIMHIAEYSSAPSVKVLTDRLYPNDPASPTTKRRWLWEECKSHGLETPEAVLHGVRLILLKAIIDSRHWTPDRVARHFGFDAARNLNKSCKTRYGMSLRKLRYAPMPEITELADFMIIPSERILHIA